MDKKLIAMAISAGMSSQFSIFNERVPFSTSTGAKSNKYKPHQGKKECERRLKKINHKR